MRSTPEMVRRSREREKENAKQDKKPLIDIWLEEAIKEQESQIDKLRGSLCLLKKQDTGFAQAHLVMIRARLDAVRAFQDALMGPALGLRTCFDKEGK